MNLVLQGAAAAMPTQRCSQKQCRPCGHAVTVCLYSINSVCALLSHKTCAAGVVSRDPSEFFVVDGHLWDRRFTAAACLEIMKRNAKCIPSTSQRRVAIKQMVNAASHASRSLNDIRRNELYE